MIYETILVDSKNNQLEIPCYQIGVYLEKKVLEFCDQNVRNKNLFNEFKKDYSYFKPYLEFAIIHLGYKIINPLIIEESILISKDEQLNNISHNSVNNTESIYKYKKCIDKNYDIEKLNCNNIKNGILTPDEYQISIVRETEQYHEQLFEIILIQKIIYDEFLYNDYKDCMTKRSDDFYNINSYFRNRLGYVQICCYEDMTGFFLCNKYLDNNIKKTIETVIKKYPKMIKEEEDVENELEICFKTK